MFIVYDLIFLIIAIIFLPVYLFKGKFHGGFFKRFGILPKDAEFNRPIWIHAVSVGEVMAVRGLIEALKRAYPEKQIVISTVTQTGNRIAQDIAKGEDFVTYLPLDLASIVKSVIDRVDPCIFIVAETEIWPNLISYLYRRNIPVVTINGRISDRSFKGYRRIRYLLRPILNRFSIFCVQSQRDAERFLALGAPEAKVRVTGNMKFDNASLLEDRIKKCAQDYRRILGLQQKEKLFVAASTHPQEEKIITDTFRTLSREFADLRLLVAPRHPERSEEVLSLIKNSGFPAQRISLLDKEGRVKAGKAVFILDTVGELVYFCNIAEIVFVGGSLIKKGGHNILEPASLGKPVLFGPHMFNFRDIAELFLENKAGIPVSDGKDLTSKIAYLLRNPGQAAELSRRAKELVLRNQGATQRVMEYIAGLL